MQIIYQPATELFVFQPGHGQLLEIGVLPKKEFFFSTLFITCTEK